MQKTFQIKTIVSLDTNSDGFNRFNIFRHIGTQKIKTLHNKDNRPHLISENVEYIENATEGVLRVAGHLTTELNINF